MVIPIPSDSSASSYSNIQNKMDSIWEESNQEIQVIKKITKPYIDFPTGIRKLDKYLNEEYLGR